MNLVADENVDAAIISRVILFRLAGIASETKGKILVSALEAHARELSASFTVIGPRSRRRRPGSAAGNDSSLAPSTTRD